jgi:3-hydroxyisobutyrate dehydrogenase-like beta-hydroxyacid dehydrogenase
LILKQDPGIGLIGIGLLGAAIAERLHLSGFHIYGYDADSSKLGAAMQSGHVQEMDPAAIAVSCNRVLLCLPNSNVVESVVNQLEAHLRPGTIVVDSTTGQPSAVEHTAARLALGDVHYVDACIGGSSEDARQRRATVMFGGSEHSFHECRPLFDAFARSSFHLGPAGAGTRMKLTFNLVLGLNRAVLAEGLSFAQSVGISPESALAVLKDGAAYSRVMDSKGKKMIEGDFEPQARLSQHLKDVHLILEEASAKNTKLPFSELHEMLLSELEAAGYGGEDNSAIIRWFKSET